MALCGYSRREIEEAMNLSSLAGMGISQNAADFLKIGLKYDRLFVAAEFLKEHEWLRDSFLPIVKPLRSNNLQLTAYKARMGHPIDKIRSF